MSKRVSEMARNARDVVKRANGLARGAIGLAAAAAWVGLTRVQGRLGDPWSDGYPS